MTKLTYTLILCFSIVLLFSCKEEELTPYEDAAKSQQAGIDASNEAGNNNSGGGGSGGGTGGGTAVDEYFSAVVDGVAKSNPDPVYQEVSGIKQINSTPISGNDIFLISINGALEVKTINNPIIGYFSNSTNSYQSFNGQLVLDSVTTTLIQGTFFFDAASSSTNDTVVVTNGRFRVKR